MAEEIIIDSDGGDSLNRDEDDDDNESEDGESDRRKSVFRRTEAFRA